MCGMFLGDNKAVAPRPLDAAGDGNAALSAEFVREPRVVLITGPIGSGKTQFARHLALWLCTHFPDRSVVPHFIPLPRALC
jgi:hypothetical protein